MARPHVLDAIPGWFKNGVMLILFWVASVYGTEFVRSQFRAREIASVVENSPKNPDGTVNVNGLLLGKFLEAYEKQVTYQERQTQIQGDIARMIEQQNVAAARTLEVLQQHQREAAPAIKAVSEFFGKIDVKKIVITERGG